MVLVRLLLLILSFFLALAAGKRLYYLPLSDRLCQLQKNPEIFIPPFCEWYPLPAYPSTTAPQSITRIYCKTTPESPLTVDIVRALTLLNGYSACCHANSRSLCTELVTSGTGAIVMCGQRGQCLNCEEATEAALDVVEECRKDGRVEGIWEKEGIFTIMQLIVGKVRGAKSCEVEEGKSVCKLWGGYTAWGGNIDLDIEEDESGPMGPALEL